MIKALLTMAIRLTPKGRRRRKKAEANQLCCGCMRPLSEGKGKIVRGNHYNCWRSHQQGVVAGAWTDRERVEDGYILEAGKGGRKKANPVALEMQARLKAKKKK